jgi:hypothetical protein
VLGDADGGHGEIPLGRRRLVEFIDGVPVAVCRDGFSGAQPGVAATWI